MSRSFSFGITSVLMPAWRAPYAFSKTPPTGRTRPASEISPVTATSWRIFLPVTAETSCVLAETVMIGEIPEVYFKG